MINDDYCPCDDCVRQQPEYIEINNELKKATEAVTKAMSDPEARLRAMFNAKIRGDM